MMISTTSSRSPWENGARYLPNRHEGILVLDLSKVEIGKSTLVAYAVPLVAFLSQSRVSSNSNVNKRDHRIISSFCESILKHRIENCGQKGDDGPHGIFFGNICFICNNNNNNHIESDVASFLSQFFQSIPAMSNQLHNFPREHRHVNGDDPVPVLYALIFITNSAKLFVHDSYIVFCNDSVGKLCRRVVFAEQNASVDINSSTIVASSVGAICIQSCQGLLHDVHITNWRNFYDMITHNCSCDVMNVSEVGKQDGGKKIPTISDFFFRMGDSRKKRAVSSPTSSPAERSAGIVVEQGGSLTARKCTITGLYFGFSIITFSVAHFYGCDATYVVNGYTVDASTATFENCSAWTSHVGVFVLNQAKCEITENGDDFLAKDFFGQHCSFTNPTSSINLQYNSSQESYGLHAQAMTCDSTGQAFYPHGIGLSGLARKPFKMNRTGESLRMIGSPSKPSPIHPLPPKSDAVRDMRCYYGETYGIEVRGATLRASGIQVLKAQRACIYAYPQHRPEVLSQPTARDGFDNSFTNDWPASIVSDINLDKCMFCSPSAQRALLRQIKTGNTNPYHNHELGSSNTGNPFVCRSSLTLESVDCKGSVQVEDEEYFNILNDISVINASGRTGKQYSLDNGSCYSDERHIVTYQGNDECGVKLINSKAKLHHCITVDLRLAFVIKREMTASFEGCFAVGSYIGFLVEDNSMATLRDCGACAKYIALLVRNHSCVEMDSSCSFEKGSLLSTSDTTCTGPESQVPRDASFKSLMRNRKLARSIGGLLSNIFVASLNGVECESSVVQCRRVSVLPVSGCAFHVHGGSTLHLAESRVLLSSNAVLHTLIESQKDRDIKRKDEEKDYGVSAVNKIDPYGTVRSSYDAEKLAFFGLFQLHYLDLIKSSTESVPSSGVGLKVWSNSTAYIRNTEVRGGAYGVVAIGPEARVFAEHLRILAAQHGLKIESAAQAELVDCFISSLQYSVHVSANARCLIQKGSYSGRCFGIICTKNSLLHIKNSVKISRFCRAGIYLSKSAIMETEEGSRLEVKESFKEDLQEPIQVVSAFDPPSSKRIVRENRMSVCVLFESHARAIIHCAILGGGAAYGVRAQTGAFAFFQHCNIQNVRLIGLHVLSSSSVYMDQGSTIDVLNEPRHHRDYLIQPQYPLPEAFEYTPTIPSLDAFPYSLVVEHGAVCTFLSLDNTPHSLSRCWFNLNRPRDPFFFCVSIYTCVLSTLKVLCLLQHLRFLWLSSRLYMCLSKAFQRDVSIPFRIPIGRFWGRVGLPLQWTMRILLHTYRYPAALLHKVKFGVNIFVNKQSKIAVIRSRRPTSLAFADASMEANNFSYRSIGQSSSITNERGESKFHARYQPAPVVSNKFCSTSHTHVRGLRFWQSGKSKTHWSAPLPFVSRVSGRIHVLGECNLYEVSLKLPLCLTVRPKGSPCDMSLFTMNSNTGSKAVEYEGTQGQDQTQALESSRVNNASDKGVCLCHAPMIVSNSGSLTLRRCNLTCLTKGVSLPLRLDLSTFDYHMLCCSGPSARAHLCEVHIKIASLQSDAANDMTKSPCPRRLITHYFPYCYAKVVIHASRKGTIVLCRVTNESLCSFQEPPPSLSAKSLQGGAMRTELDDLDFLMRTAAKMIPKDNSRAKETGCGNSCSCDPNSATNLKIVSVLSPTLLHISVYASEQCSVHIYQTFLHHLFASRKAKLTLTQSAIMGAASVTQIESGAMLHLQQSLLVGSLIGI